MKVIENKKKKNIFSVVCCLHGDEVFGLDVFNYFEKNIDKYPGLKIILANEAAIKAKKRSIKRDLNRVFPGKKNSPNEEGLAYKILEEVKNSRYVLDIHTTTSDIKMTPIVTRLNKVTKRILNLCRSKEVVLIDKKIAERSLIGQLKGGVSLEFNFEYAKNISALGELVKIVDNIFLQRNNKAKNRKVFYINGLIDKKTILPWGVENFDLIRPLGFYPFLIGEKSYVDMQGFLAKRTREIKI